VFVIRKVQKNKGELKLNGMFQIRINRQIRQGMCTFRKYAEILGANQNFQDIGNTTNMAWAVVTGWYCPFIHWVQNLFYCWKHLQSFCSLMLCKHCLKCSLNLRDVFESLCVSLILSFWSSKSFKGLNQKVYTSFYPKAFGYLQFDASSTHELFNIFISTA
jgi:hypothetical protein